MARSWAELLGEDGAERESEEERQGFFGRLRDSLGRSRRALTEQLEAAVFDPGDEAAGVSRVMIQHLAHHDLETVERIGRDVIAEVA